MKNKVNLGNSKVEESFCFRKPVHGSCDILCYYVATQEGEGMESHPTTIEHFDTESLREFLYFRDKETNGILQRFVEAKGIYNTIIRTVWSPNIFLAERRSNVFPLEDKKISLHKRSVTYEGDEYLSSTVSITDTLLGKQIERVCRNVVQHVFACSDGALQIGRMVLHFKVDKGDKLWFLWCSSLRLLSNPIRPEPSLPVNLSDAFTVPEHVKRFLSTVKLPAMPSHLRRKVFMCPCCGRRIAPEARCECTYKLVVDYLARAKHIEAITRAEGADGTTEIVTEEEVPEVLQRLHPNLSLESFKVLCRDPLFQYSRMTVCDSCFLQYTERPDIPLPAVPPGSGGTGGAATLGGTRGTRSSAMGATGEGTILVERRAAKRRQLDEQAEQRMLRSAVIRRSQSTSVALSRSTRLAENYVMSVSSNALLKEFGSKVVGRLPDQIKLSGVRNGAVSAPPDLGQYEAAAEPEDGGLQLDDGQDRGDAPKEAPKAEEKITSIPDYKPLPTSFQPNDPEQAKRLFALQVAESEEKLMEDLKKAGPIPPSLLAALEKSKTIETIQRVNVTPASIGIPSPDLLKPSGTITASPSQGEGLRSNSRPSSSGSHLSRPNSQGAGSPTNKSPMHASSPVHAASPKHFSPQHVPSPKHFSPKHAASPKHSSPKHLTKPAPRSPTKASSLTPATPPPGAQQPPTPSSDPVNVDLLPPPEPPA
eukprot:CAMPEP_0114556688 /NCGR_PEP_ID=MMETSP0114-20121206/9422_1 /TAXON_ID=31324 /ORGANISM="Goniomonas sp, Strain m" /LENGTH=705 /DNA_ID=CAMNT_0001741909 /DNA_START=200 /DNA_END=2313 /DNA_ORIENTATION=-